jgi:1,4-dihydroxy-2-naphthoate octaprenyltransferase
MTTVEATAAQSVPAWRAWVMAARLRTLPVAVAPVVVGTAVAASEGVANPLPAFGALIGALLLQLVSNFANDVFDMEKGADTEERIGPPRATQLGLLSPDAMRMGIAVALGAAAGVGLYLFWVAGWPVLVIGLLSMVAAVAYTGGPWPFGYKGLGDPAVFIFFGVIAVVGSHYVQSLELSLAALAASIGVGALATAILVVNNLRDIDTDEQAGKRTLAVRLGRAGARREYVVLLGVAYALLPFYWLGLGRSIFVMLPALSLPKALALVRTLHATQEGPPLNAALAGTAQLTLLYSVLLASGWLL